MPENSLGLVEILNLDNSETLAITELERLSLLLHEGHQPLSKVGSLEKPEISMGTAIWSGGEKKHLEKGSF